MNEEEAMKRLRSFFEIFSKEDLIQAREIMNDVIAGKKENE